MYTGIKPTNKKENFFMDDRVKEIFNTYLNVISPLIVQLEVLDNEFPVEILNEIRAIFTHFARSATTENKEVCSENIEKAERHVKRAVLDCFKYMCFVYDDKYIEFEKIYENVDLSLIDNGAFLPELSKRRKQAIHLLSKAKKKEIVSESIDEVFDDFENAYNAFANVDSFINDSYEKLQKLKQRVIKKNKRRAFFDVCAIVGTLFGIIGVILTII